MYLRFFAVLPAWVTFGALLLPNVIQAQIDPEFVQKNSQDKIRIELDGGLAYLLGSTKNAKTQLKNYGIAETEADAYYRNFKLGEEAGISATYFLHESFGLGLDYRIFTTKASVMGYLDVYESFSKVYGPFTEQVYTNFWAVSWFQNLAINQKLNFYSRISMGWASYRNEAKIMVSPVLLTGNAPAMRISSGLTCQLTEFMAIDFSLSGFASVIREMTLNDGKQSSTHKLDKVTQENMSRVSLTTGLVIQF